jgi:hypothetical protein
VLIDDGSHSSYRHLLGLGNGHNRSGGRRRGNGLYRNIPQDNVLDGLEGLVEDHDVIGRTESGAHRSLALIPRESLRKST